MEYIPNANVTIPVRPPLPDYAKKASILSYLEQKSFGTQKRVSNDTSKNCTNSRSCLFHFRQEYLNALKLPSQHIKNPVRHDLCVYKRVFGLQQRNTPPDVLIVTLHILGSILSTGTVTGHHPSTEASFLLHFAPLRKQIAGKKTSAE